MNTNLTELRKYRLVLDPYEDGFMFNNDSKGIALFDLISAFLGAYLLDVFFELPLRMRTTRTTYYYVVIPVGILVHLLFNKNTYLNKKLFSLQSDLCIKLY
jgi:hypothetical protein